MTNDLPDSETLINVPKAAAYLGCSTKTVDRLIKSGDLPAIQLPSPKSRGHRRIALRDLWILKAKARF